MGEGRKPKFRIVMSRKDGQNITYTDYKGEEKTGKYAPVGAVFHGKFLDSMDVAVDKKVTLDPSQYWFKLFTTDNPSKSGGRRAPADNNDF